jgi:hypothetical protein
MVSRGYLGAFNCTHFKFEGQRVRVRTQIVALRKRFHFSTAKLVKDQAAGNHRVKNSLQCVFLSS